MNTGDAGEQKLGSEELKAEASKGEKKPETSESKGDVSKDKPTFTEKDVSKKVADALTAYVESDDFTKVVQSAKDKSINQEMKPLRDELKSLKEGKSEKDLAEIEARELKQWEEDGIPKDAIKNYQNERRGQVKAAEELLGSLEGHKEDLREIRAYKIAKSAGVDMEELLKCETLEEMEQKARELSHGKYSSEVQKLNDRIKELEGKGEGKDGDKIDSGKEGLSGANRSLEDRYPSMNK